MNEKKKNDQNNLMKTNSSYERYIKAFINVHRTSKIAMIKRIIDFKSFDKNVFVIINSINALILY